MNGVIYARYSSDNQREESIEGQIRECLEYAKKNDINIIDSYIDRAFSAKNPDLQTGLIFPIIIATLWKEWLYAKAKK